MSPSTPARRRLFAFVLAMTITAGGAAAQGQDPTVLGFKKTFVVEITNPSPIALENHPVVLDVAAIRAAVAWDFNTYMYALFELKGGEYAFVVSQADDLDKDRYHDEIVFVRTLPPSSTTRLLCYYTPERSLPRLVTTDKAFARESWQANGPEAGWESNLAAYTFVHGRIEFYGKLQSGLILKKLPAPEDRPQDWGMDVLDAGESAGLGGLSLWDGNTRVPLFGASAPQAKVTVISPGPVRALVKAEYPAVKTAAGEVGLTAFLSAFADNAFSRHDVLVASKAAGQAVYGPALQKLASETVSADTAKGYLAVWGKGADKAGDIGLAVVFPPGLLSGTEEASLDHAVKLKGKDGVKQTHWVLGAWERGITSPGVPAAKNWPGKVADLARRLLVPVKVEFKAK
jgi:hypothetical protein